MTGLVEMLRTTPCLLEPMDGVIIAEPLRFISARKIYARGKVARREHPLSIAERRSNSIEQRP